jgi:aminoglycoside phosphotransferase (APT) family kinase protein
LSIRYPPRIDAAATAAALWAARGEHPIDPERAQVLKSSKKCTVLRIPAMDAHHPNVVVKIGRAVDVDAEIAFYERVAPCLPVEVPAMHFALRLDTGRWVFMEDAGVDEYRRERPEHVRAMTSWLAAVHREASSTPATSMPSRTATHYLDHMASARAAISVSLDEQELGVDDRRLLIEFRMLLDRVRVAWDEVVRVCDRGPITLVHGDLAAKNIRMRPSPGAPRVLVLDWETAGWGWAAPDLASGSLGWGIDLDRYRVEAGEAGEAMDGWTERDLRSYAAIGAVLRYLAAADWAARSLRYAPGKRAVSYLRAYSDPLARALADCALHESTGNRT